METFTIILLAFLVVCAVATALCKSIFISVIIFMGYGVVMSIIWLILRAPDLAITEAAVGVGITSILFFVAFRKMNLINRKSIKRSGEDGKK